MKDLGCKSLSKRIYNHGVCANMLYKNWTTLDSFFSNQNLMSICFDFEELLLLLEYMTAGLLSQYIFSGFSIPPKIRSLVKKFHSHIP